MKKIVFLLLILFCLNGYSQGYDYPIKFGTEEYKALKTYKEIVNNFQIPENVIEQMTTDELLESYIFYPLLLNAFAFSNLESGLKKVSERFNAYNELQNRNDLSEKVLKRLLEIDFSKSYKKDSINMKDKETFRYSLFEVYVSQNNFLDKFKKEDLIKILKSSCKSYSDKKSKETFMKYTSGYLSINILDKLNTDIWELNKRNYKAIEKYHKDVFSPNSEELDSLMNFILTLKFD